jgi:hypothetical protein
MANRIADRLLLLRLRLFSASPLLLCVLPLREVIELPLSTWACLTGWVVVFGVVMLGTANDEAALCGAWVLCGWMVAIVAFTYTRRCDWALSCLASQFAVAPNPPPPGAPAPSRHSGFTSVNPLMNQNHSNSAANGSSQPSSRNAAVPPPPRTSPPLPNSVGDGVGGPHGASQPRSAALVLPGSTLPPWTQRAPTRHSGSGLTAACSARCSARVTVTVPF